MTLRIKRLRPVEGEPERLCREGEGASKRPPRIKALLLAALLLLTPGCGTLLNLGFGPKPFGGVGADCFMAGECLDEPQTLPFVLFWLADLPFSLLGDTLTLPYTLGDPDPHPLSAL